MLSKLVTNFRKFKKTSYDFLKSNEGKETKSKILLFFGDICINGIFLNFAALVLFGAYFSFWTFPGYGLAWWYIKEEVPRVLNKIIGGR